MHEAIRGSLQPIVDHEPVVGVGVVRNWRLHLERRDHIDLEVRCRVVVVREERHGAADIVVGQRQHVARRKGLSAIHPKTGTDRIVWI